MRKMTKQAMKTNETRQRIVATATQLMRCDGFENTSVRQICEEANVSIGSFYHLFESKAALLDAILGDVNSFYTDAEFDYESDSPFLFVDRLVDSNLNLIQTLTPTIVFKAFFEPPSGNKTIYFEQRSSNQFTLKHLEGFQNAGKLKKELSIEQMQTEMVSIFCGSLYTYYTLERMDIFPEKLREIYYHLFSFYLAPS
ncbi:TetR/AcrR family transcriptional regulator [uncultured Dysosmobacter sp.]|uniref:TetR/AcrR family transcriptional regulator n=1 Tax=uncultured Dysosmobacter sp. TaxID=2591384 RepID=UPI002635F209|nr:TetR/AcrR family transcriptional regulator [uncultured Dysosmobacter sp.]